MTQDTLTNAKIKALELIKCAPGVPKNMLFDVLTTLYIDYFVIVQAYNELEGSNLITIKAGTDKDLVNGSDDLVYITNLGEVMLEELIKTLDTPSYLELQKKGAELNDSVKQKALTLANYEIIANNDSLEDSLYKVHLSRKLPNSTSSIEINIVVNNKDEADALCSKWHNDKNFTLYNSILRDLGI